MTQKSESVREAEQLLDRLGLPHAAWRLEACNEALNSFTLRLAEEAEREAEEIMADGSNPYSERSDKARQLQSHAAWLREKAR